MLDPVEDVPDSKADVADLRAGEQYNQRSMRARYLEISCQLFGLFIRRKA